MLALIDTLNAIMSEAVSKEVSLTNSAIRLIVAALLGVVIGAERKRKGQAAGARTFALISMGSCLAMLLSIYVPQIYLGLKNGDPGRIAAQVITGVGFLGGGAMIHMRGAVKGLTTAAGIWLTAIMGMAVGVGMYMGAILATLLCIMVLTCFDWWEHRGRMGQVSRVINIKTEGTEIDLDRYRNLFRQCDVHLSNFYVSFDYEHNRCDVNFVVLAHTGSQLLEICQKLRELSPTLSITLTSQPDI